jgi:hypothetical protein
VIELVELAAGIERGIECRPDAGGCVDRKRFRCSLHE